MEDFDDLMTDTVTIEPLDFKDDYGTPVFLPAVTYVCRIDGATKQKVNLNGVEQSVNAIIYIPDNPTIGPMDRLTLPAGFIPQQPPILKVNLFTDDAGAHHVEIAV